MANGPKFVKNTYVLSTHCPFFLIDTYATAHCEFFCSLVLSLLRVCSLELDLQLLCWLYTN